jgi:hypothetical protein
MLKEIGDPHDIGHIWFVGRNDDLCSKIITHMCRQNTNYDIVRYAAHPFFLKDTLFGKWRKYFLEKNIIDQQSHP